MEIYHPHLILLSGASGGGKSSILKELSKRGYSTHKEPCLEVLKEQESLGLKEIHIHKRELFLDLVFSRCLAPFKNSKLNQQTTFLDRGLVDLVRAGGEKKTEREEAAKNFRYQKKVFFFPPWEEIYKQDRYRQHDFKKSLEDYKKLKDEYLKFDYELLEVPKKTVEERVAFILESLRDVFPS